MSGLTSVRVEFETKPLKCHMTREMIEDLKNIKSFYDVDIDIDVIRKEKRKLREKKLKRIFYE